MAANPRIRRRMGLRMRMTLFFALGALVLSVTLATLSYERARSYLLRQRELSAARQANVNALIVQGALPTAPSILNVLASLERLAGSHPLLFYNGNWHADTVSVGRKDLPPDLQSEVLAGRARRQTFRLKGKPQLAVGVPLPRVNAAYFEVISLEELSRTLSVLRDALIAGALITVVAGAAIGRWGSRRVVAPVRKVAQAATAVAGGRLDVRVDVGSDPDLATVATAFNQMTSALDERVKRDARFASAVSHELRSPLTTLSAGMEVLLARRAELPERAQMALDLVAAEVDRFQRLVQDLLEISRIDVGATTATWEDVRLGEFVMHALRLAGRRGFLVDLDPAAASAIVRADKRRLERVLANLVENAENYGGGVIRVVLEQVNGNVRLAVEDSGPGVAADERERIFERFARGQAGRSRGSSDGTGLGLSLVAEHVRLHGGRVWVEDRRGGGARFVVELPTAPT